jgi:hypothetical protein
MGLLQINPVSVFNRGAHRTPPEKHASPAAGGPTSVDKLMDHSDLVTVGPRLHNRIRLRYHHLTILGAHPLQRGLHLVRVLLAHVREPLGVIGPLRRRQPGR